MTPSRKSRKSGLLPRSICPAHYTFSETNGSAAWHGGGSVGAKCHVSVSGYHSAQWSQSRLNYEFVSNATCNRALPEPLQPQSSFWKDRRA